MALISIPTVGAGDAYVSGQNATWPPSAGDTLSTNGTIAFVGKQAAAGPIFAEFVSMLRFDTSVIADDATVISAELQLYVTSTTNVDSLSVVGDYTPLAFTLADFQRNVGNSAFNAVSISALTASAYNSITLKDAAANINKTGNTDIKLGSTNLASDAAPTGISVLQYRNVESTSGATPPTLAVTARLGNLELETFLIHAIGVGATSSEGEERYDSTRNILQHHDGVREKSISEIGYKAYAYPIGGGPTQTPSDNLSMSTNGVAFATPVVLESHMLLESVSYWDLSSANARGPMEFGIYEERLNTSGTLDLLSGAVGTIAAYTPSAASLRTMTVTTPPVYLSPGCYWLVLKNNHASNGWALGASLPGTMSQNSGQTKALTTAALPSTLDFVTSWTKSTRIPGVRLNGRVFGQTSAF